MPRPSLKTIAWIAAWCALFAIALYLDAPIARWAHDTGLAVVVRRTSWSWRAGWAWWVKIPGEFPTTLAVVALLMLFRRIDLRRAAFVIAVVALSGLNALVKWTVGRTRPYKLPLSVPNQPRPFLLQPFWHGPRGLMAQVDLSFPSGHVCTATALAAGVWFVHRPTAWPLIACAAAIAVERVLENAHYASDTVAAAALSTAGALLAHAILWPWVSASRVADAGANPDALTSELGS